MIRSIQSVLLLGVLAIAPLENAINPIYVAQAQAAATAVCDPNAPLQNRLAMAEDQVRSAMESAQPDMALSSLQETLTIAGQLQDGRRQADLLQQWLLDANEGYPTTRWQRLTQGDQAARWRSLPERESPQLRATLDQFLALANQLPSGYSYVKARSLAAIARYYTVLEQRETPSARQAQEQARQAATLIRGSDFTASALIDIAETYAFMGDTTSALVVLIQVGGAVEQIPPGTSERLKLSILQRMATTYAHIGHFAPAEAIAADLPDEYELRSIALRGIVEGSITVRNLSAAETTAQAIPAATQRILALGKVAIGYHNANQPAYAARVMAQAREQAESATGLNAEFVFGTLVDTYLQLGQRDEALELAQTQLKVTQQESIKSVMVAYSQAGQQDVVEAWLSGQLSDLQAIADPWEQSFSLGSLLELAIDIQQFDWIRQSWSQLAAISYGPQDEQIVSVVTAYAATGQYDQAAAWAKQLPLANRPVLRVRLLAAIALSAHQAGQTTWANNLLQQTLQSIDDLVATHQRQFPEEVTQSAAIEPGALVAIAVVYAQMGQADLTRELLQRVGTIEQPFEVFMAARQYVGALQIARATSPAEVRIERLQRSATALLQQNRFDLALPVVNELSEPSRQAQLLLAIAQRYGDLQQVEAALPILAQAFQVAQTIPGEESQVDRFGTEGYTVIDREDDRGSLLEAIALQYAQLGQGDQARQVANQLRSTHLRQQVMASIRCIL
ncbi:MULTISPECIES: hypothetical protein [Cyanophyceae]|uniref:Tetratricopeptide repeat protein n=1 Tax=Leptolyngbya subtilissima DQ-A4 TaxID=2933933 RepID=A0ABV0K5N2_9CYAN|nr:hypothetical protein [Nodosilinea sp. FACHB-141]MBD2112812.1 hypothetical protein [Nodosilinea sp. FACHB-141]